MILTFSSFPQAHISWGVGRRRWEAGALRCWEEVAADPGFVDCAQFKVLAFL